MKNRLLYYYLFLILGFLLQAAALKVFQSYPNFVPQLVLLLVILFAFHHTFIETLWFGFAAGMLSEIFSIHLFGSYILSFAVMGITVHFVSRNFTTPIIRWPTAILLVGGGTLFLSLVVGVSTWLGGVKFFSWGIIWTMLVNFLLFYPLNFVSKILEHEKAAF